MLYEEELRLVRFSPRILRAKVVELLDPYLVNDNLAAAISSLYSTVHDHGNRTVEPESQYVMLPRGFRI